MLLFNDDHAWITEGKDQGYEVIKAQPGKVWHADAEAARHGFAEVKTVMHACFEYYGATTSSLLIFRNAYVWSH